MFAFSSNSLKAFISASITSLRASPLRFTLPNASDTKSKPTASFLKTFKALRFSSVNLAVLLPEAITAWFTPPITSSSNAKAGIPCISKSAKLESNSFGLFTNSEKLVSKLTNSASKSTIAFSAWTNPKVSKPSSWKFIFKSAITPSSKKLETSSPKFTSASLACSASILPRPAPWKKSLIVALCILSSISFIASNSNCKKFNLASLTSPCCKASCNSFSLSITFCVIDTLATLPWINSSAASFAFSCDLL